MLTFELDFYFAYAKDVQIIDCDIILFGLQNITWKCTVGLTKFLMILKKEKFYSKFILYVLVKTVLIFHINILYYFYVNINNIWNFMTCCMKFEFKTLEKK